MADKNFPADFKHITPARNIALFGDDGVSSGFVSVADLLSQIQINDLPSAVGDLLKQTVNGSFKSVAGASVSGHRAVMSNSAGLIVHSDPTTSVGYNFLGISLNASAVNALVEIAVPGEVVVELSWNWQSGLPLYVAANGGLTQITPEVGVLHQVGSAITQTSMLVQSFSPIIRN